ncbi:PCI domain-containing protein, partial [Klebsiella pneumoniae]|nr:PCI domain-containing protein [Klebsiella pneumoniae]
MMEHNIIAASRLYVNITLNGLGRLLDLHSLAAETMVRRMIVQGRLKAEIDQVAGLIVFHEQKSREIGLA